jgi:ankyrin repeat protein
MKKIRGSNAHQLIIQNAPFEQIKTKLESMISKKNKNNNKNKNITLKQLTTADQSILLRTASKLNQTELVEYLIQNGAQINACNNQALQFAIQNQNYKLIQLLTPEYKQVKPCSNTLTREQHERFLMYCEELNLNIPEIYYIDYNVLYMS